MVSLGVTVGLLGAIFTFAVHKGFRIDNPVHGVVKFAEGRRQRRLTYDEYRMLGIALSKVDQDIWKSAIAATWLMVLTGWRRGEVLAGASLRPLSDAACAVIRSQPRIGNIVFPTSLGDTPIVGHRKMWLRIAKLADSAG